MEPLILKDDEEIWTIEKLDNVQRNANSLGVTEEECNYLRRLLTNGESVPVINAFERDYKENYRIICNDVTTGNITLTFHDYLNKWEIDIFIYDDFQGKGIALKALSQLIESEGHRGWTANVLENNPNFDAITYLLKKLNFKKDKDIISNAKNIPVHLFVLN